MKTIAFLRYPRPFGGGSFGTRNLVMVPHRAQGAGRVNRGAQRFEPRIDIGDHTRIGRHVMITAIKQVCIGDFHFVLVDRRDDAFAARFPGPSIAWIEDKDFTVWHALLTTQR